MATTFKQAQQRMAKILKQQATHTEKTQKLAEQMANHIQAGQALGDQLQQAWNDLAAFGEGNGTPARTKEAQPA